MNFTREPIIETIISAKEGHKLSLKSSKRAEQEEILVDAIEVVSFGGTFFYRCQEKPRPFFFPSSDYEILEVRETKLLIKNPSVKEMIKIAGGKESKERAPRPESVEKEGEEASSLEERGPPKPEGQKRERKRHRNKKGRGQDSMESGPKAAVSDELVPALPSEVVPSALLFNHLLQPPEGLISESLKKYKRAEEQLSKVPGISEELVESSGHTPALEERIERDLPEEAAFSIDVLEESGMHSSFETEFAPPATWQEGIEEKH